MSDNIIEITENTNYTVSVETNLEHNNNVVIELTNPTNVDIINNTTVLVGDLPQGYPLDWTVGNLPISRVSGLDIDGGNYINVVDSSGIYIISATGLQPSGNYSSVGHDHASSDITDFAFSVSGLLPVKNISAGNGIGIVNSSGDFNVSVTGTFGLTGEQVDDRISSLLVDGDYVHLNYNDLTDKLTISVTGLQPSGNYSLVGHQHLIADVSGLQNSLDSKQPSGAYASGIHYHISSDITDFNNSVDSRIVLANLQPSGNYSVVGHTHTSSNITDFNSSVSGLLPVKNISSGSGINITNNNGDFNVAVTGQFGLTSEQVDDRVSNLLVGINNIILNYDDNLDKLTIGTSGLQPSGNYSVIGHSHSISDVSGLQNALDNKQPSGSYAPLAHSHTSSNITDFSSSVNSLVSGLYAPLNSPNFSGVPTAPTANSGTNNFQIANTAFVRNEISSLVNSAPSTLDTLNELATALGNDPNFATTVSNTLGTKANLTGANFTGSISGPSGDFSVLKQNGVIVSISGHSHISNDITNFNSSVSGLLPVTNVVGGTNINVVSSGTTYTINVSGQLGLTAEQVDDRVAGLLVAGTGISLNYDDPNNTLTVSTSGLAFTSGANFNSLSVTGVPVSISGHLHSYTDITNWASGIEKEVTTLLIGGNYINLNYDNTADTLTISASGLQPSGNYSIVGHSHTVSDINNFGSGVSGLLPVKNLVGSGYINVISNTGLYTISTSGLQPSGNYSVVGHSHTTSDITNFNSTVSGLLPTINNSGNNRLLTSTGTSVGINAESNLTFDGSILNVFGQIDVDNITLNANIISTNVTNTDLILKPDGNGALIADTSGNVRGVYSNDFQRERTSASGVAAGGYSVICGGSDNRTSNPYSVVCGGQTNTASNSLATVGGGDLNTANGNRSTICGGGSNIASGASSNIAGGSSNQSTGPYSIVPGGFRAKATRHGELSHGAGFFVNPGDAQHTILIARRNTTDATADVVLTLNGLTPVSTNILNIPAQTMWTFSIKISAYNNANSEGAWWIIRGGIRRNNSNATTLVGSLIVESGADSSMSAASATVVADDTNEALEIRVTGIAGKSIRWVAVIDISQVSFGVI